MKEYTLYKLIFPNGKVYIGQTINFTKRMRGHKNDSNNLNRIKKNCYVNNAIRKFGWDNVDKVIILTCLEDKIDSLEKEYISKYNSTNRDYGYNREDGGNKNKHLNDITKKLISIKRGKERRWSKKVAQIEPETNLIIRIWESLSDVRKELKISTSNISTMCNGKQKVCTCNGVKYYSFPKTSGGYKWKFI